MIPYKQAINMRYYFLFFILLFQLQPGSAETDMFYAAGDHLAQITLQDQHDKTISVDHETRVVLFTRDMSGGKVVRKAIDGEEAGFLADNHIVFLSNISGMPGLVARMIALPMMRKHPYSIALDRDGETTKKIPSRGGNTTILILDKLEIKSIAFIEEPSDVMKAIISTCDP